MLYKSWHPSCGPLLRCGEHIKWSVITSVPHSPLSVTPVLQEDLLGSWNEDSNLSIVIVRHPMSRLASVYYQKFIELSNNKAWANVGINIISTCPIIL